MKEYFISLQNEIGVYYKILKFIIYFSVGSVFLILINKILRFFKFMFSKFSEFAPRGVNKHKKNTSEKTTLCILRFNSFYYFTSCA